MPGTIFVFNDNELSNAISKWEASTLTDKDVELTSAITPRRSQDENGQKPALGMVHVSTSLICSSRNIRKKPRFHKVHFRMTKNS